MAIKFIGNIKVLRNAEKDNEAVRFSQVTKAIEDILKTHNEVYGIHTTTEERDKWNNKLIPSENTITPVENKLVALTHTDEGFVTGSTEGDLTPLINASMKADRIDGLMEELDKKVHDGSFNMITDIALSIDDVNHKILMHITDGIDSSVKELEIPVADVDTAGLLSKEYFEKINSLKANAEAIEASVGRLPAHDFETETLTDELVNEYISTLHESVTVHPGTTIVNKFNNHRWIYSDNPVGWTDQGADDVGIATEEFGGTFRSLNETPGYLTVDPVTGDCYVLGLDSIISSTKEGKVIMPSMSEDNSKKYIVAALKDDYDTHLELSYAIAKDGETKLDINNILIYELSTDKLSEIDGELLAFNSNGHLINTGKKSSEMYIGDQVSFNTIMINSDGSAWNIITKDKDQYTYGAFDQRKMFPSVYRKGDGTKYVGLGVDAENINTESISAGNVIIGNVINNQSTFKTFAPKNLDGTLIIESNSIKGHMVKSVPTSPDIDEA